MAEPRFGPGARVLVRDLPLKGHMRTPGYVRGRQGWVERCHGRYPDPEQRAYGRDGLPAKPLYLVRFRQADLWPGYGGGSADSLALDIFEHWLEPMGLEPGEIAHGS
jgi:nitrile hydratase beta subunit-like protein